MLHPAFIIVLCLPLVTYATHILSQAQRNAFTAWVPSSDQLEVFSLFVFAMFEVMAILSHATLFAVYFTHN